MPNTKEYSVIPIAQMSSGFPSHEILFSVIASGGRKAGVPNEFEMRASSPSNSFETPKSAILI